MTKNNLKVSVEEEEEEIPEGKKKKKNQWDSDHLLI